MPGLRPILALLLLLASGAQAFAAARGPDCARPHDAGHHSDVISGDVEVSTLLGDGHHHPEGRSSPVATEAGHQCPPAAAIVRAVDAPPQAESSRLAPGDAAVPAAPRPGALFRPPRTI